MCACQIYFRTVPAIALYIYSERNRLKLILITFFKVRKIDIELEKHDKLIDPILHGQFD